MSDHRLFTEFANLSKSDWLEKATRDMKGKPIATLKTSWYGIDIDPYYAVEDRQTLDLIPPIATPGSWTNYVEVPVGDEAAANKQALKHLELGATGILFNLKKKVNLPVLLEGIHLSDYAIAFTGTAIAEEYGQYRSTKDDNPKISGFCQSATPSAVKWDEEFFPTVVASDKTDEVEELVDILLSLNTLLEPVADQEAEAVTGNIAYQVSITTNYFFGIAKIRALRVLLSNFYQAFGLTYAPADFHIIARSPAWNNEAYEPHENMLKATTAAMAAISGGCNALIIAPGYADAEEEMVARNISTLLEHESYLGKVADPAAGSYFLEQLTQKIINKVWTTFKNALAS